MLAFDEPSHTYTYDGTVVPSVTQALTILNDFSKVPWQVLQAAQERGRLVHKAGEYLLRGELDWSSIDSEIQSYLVGLKKFLDESGFVALETETQVYSEKYRYAGTIDAVGYWRNGICLVDWKTSVAKPKHVGPQLAAYRQAYNEQAKNQVRRIYCVRLSPGAYKVDKIEGAADFSIFKSALNLWGYMNAAA